MDVRWSVTGETQRISQTLAFPAVRKMLPVMVTSSGRHVIQCMFKTVILSVITINKCNYSCSMVFMMRCYWDNVNLSYMVKLLCLRFIWITLVQTSNFYTVFLCSWHMGDKDSLFVNVWTGVNTYSWQQLCVTAVWHQPIIYPQVENSVHPVHHLRCWGTGPLLKRRTDSKGIMIDEWRCLVWTMLTWCVEPRELFETRPTATSSDVFECPLQQHGSIGKQIGTVR